MKPAFATQSLQATSCQREDQSGFPRQQVVQGVVTQQFMGVVLLLVFVYHHLLFIRVNTFMLYTCTKNGPAGAMYSVSDSGWMEKENHHCWFQKMFLPATSHLRETGAVILFFDGHHSHISIQLIKLSQESNVHLMLLPSNTTHVLQPLDVGVYYSAIPSWKVAPALPLQGSKLHAFWRALYGHSYASALLML